MIDAYDAPTQVQSEAVLLQLPPVDPVQGFFDFANPSSLNQLLVPDDPQHLFWLPDAQQPMPDFSFPTPALSTTPAVESHVPDIQRPTHSPSSFRNSTLRVPHPASHGTSAPTPKSTQMRRNDVVQHDDNQTSDLHCLAGMTWPFVRCNHSKNACILVDEAIRDWIGLLARPRTWSQSNITSAKGQPLATGARDRITATVQLLLSRALQTPRLASTMMSVSMPIFGPIVLLPPSEVLIHFIEIYSNRVSSTQPYLGLAGSPHVRVQDILQVDMIDVGVLLVLLLIAQGAMLADDAHCHKFAEGLAQICQVAVDDVLAVKSLTDPLVSGIASQSLTLSVWCGSENSMFSVSARRGQILQMLEPAGLFQTEKTSAVDMPDTAAPDHWARWKVQEQRHRLVYAWVYIDLELSLALDAAPMIPINALQTPLPEDDNVWHAPTSEAWYQERPRSAQGTDSDKLPSLARLYTRFIQGRLMSVPISPNHHLTLLLHPILAAIMNEQENLRVFLSDEGSVRSSGPISKTKIVAHLQDLQALLEGLSDTMYARITENDGVPALEYIGLIMTHLVVLNTLTCMPEIERIARINPPTALIDRVELLRRVKIADSPCTVLYHAGQVFRLLNCINSERRMPWWPIAAYRAAMAIWSFSGTAVSPLPSAALVSINTMGPNEKILSDYRNGTAGRPVVTLLNSRQIPALEGNGIITYCIELLTQDSTQLCKGTRAKLIAFEDRWHI